GWILQDGNHAEKTTLDFAEGKPQEHYVMKFWSDFLFEKIIKPYVGEMLHDRIEKRFRVKTMDAARMDELVDELGIMIEPQTSQRDTGRRRMMRSHSTKVDAILDMARERMSSRKIADKFANAVLLGYELPKAMGILGRGRRVYDFLTGANLAAGLYASEVWTVDYRFSEVEMAATFEDWWNNRVEREAGLKGFVPDLMDFGIIRHFCANVFDRGFASGWTQGMRAGDVVYLRSLPWYLAWWIRSDNPNSTVAGQAKAWIINLMRSLPPGVHVIIHELANELSESVLEYHPEGFAGYLMQTGLFEDETGWLSRQAKGRLEELNEHYLHATKGKWQLLDLERMDHRMVTIPVNGKVSFLRKRSSSDGKPAHARSETRATTGRSGSWGHNLGIWSIPVFAASLLGAFETGSSMVQGQEPRGTVPPAAERRVQESTEYIQALIQILRDPKDARRDQAEKALAAVGKPAVRYAMGLFLEDDVNVRRSAVRVLAMIGQPAVEDLILVLGHESPMVREVAVVSLGSIGDKTAAPVLVRKYGDEKPYVRKAIVWALLKMQANEAVPVFIHVIKGDAEELRDDPQDWAGSAIQILAQMDAEVVSKIDNTVVIQSLIQRAKTKPVFVPAVTALLAKIGRPAVPSLVKELRQASEVDARWVLKIFKQMKDPGVVPLVVEDIFQQRDDKMRDAELSVLDAIGTPEAKFYAALVRNHFLAAGQITGSVQFAREAMQSSNSSVRDHARSFLFRVLAEGWAGDRQAAAKAFDGIKDEQVCTGLVRAYLRTDNDRETSAMLKRAIVEQGATAVPHLQKILEGRYDGYACAPESLTGALEMLTQIKDVSVISVLTGVLRTQPYHPQQSEMIERALAEFGEKAVTALKEEFNEDQRSLAYYANVPWLSEGLVRALIRFGAVEEVIARAAEGKKNIPAWFLKENQEAILKDPNRAYTILTNALYSEDAESRRAAVAGLLTLTQTAVPTEDQSTEMIQAALA
ncbi:MAG: HEAT repeat domain-containing protein, partial [Candidatus Omnitrophica bacterium]|nr:HEAT repeat domain-containing protein [Candidatus Omnitrophota bacterium]